ncbi:TrfA family protein [Burkholderia pseudomallei]|nr:TrfA family protein [Burkholderia pseudomallei]CAJ3373945.1 TrfA family protein [Burkholderia pseudomallei]CAJ8955893.1 TrfA family protein [Burkholderia pseudomallei]
MFSTDTPPDSTPQPWPSLKLAHGKLDDHRAFPHSFVRSALFSSRKFSGEAVRATATESDPILLASLSNYRLVQYGGERLDQGDCEVFVWLVSRAYQRGLTGKTEARIFFSREEAAAELGRQRGTKNFRLFQESLMRLYKADIAYTTPHADGRTRLISSIEKMPPGSKNNYDYEVNISGKVGDFFRESDFRIIKNDERAKLKDYLSKWLHAFYSSHSKPFNNYSCDRIKKLADRWDTPEHIWYKKLTASLAHLQAATGWWECKIVRENDKPPSISVVKGERRFPKRKKTGNEQTDSAKAED